MMREDVIYTAALLEGEGYMKSYEYKRKTSKGNDCINRGISIRLGMSDKDVMLLQKNRFERLLGKPVNMREGFFNGKENKKMYEINLYGYKAYAIMAMIYPFMGERRKAAIEESFEVFKKVRFHRKHKEIKPLEFTDE